MEKKAIKFEMAEIRKILMGSDDDEKRSLLLTLDWYMDPYFKQDIIRESRRY